MAYPNEQPELKADDADPRIRCFERPVDDEAFERSVTTLMGRLQEKTRQTFVSEHNVLRMNHGSNWVHSARNPEPDTTMHSISAEWTIPFKDIAENDLGLIGRTIFPISEEMDKQFAQNMYGVVGAAAQKVGNVVDAKIAGSFAQSMLEMFRKLELGGDRDGNVSMPQMHVGPELYARLPEEMSKVPPELNAEIERLKAEKNPRRSRSRSRAQGKVQAGRRMSGRALLAIGCNAYDHLDSLACAEADADALFRLLIEPSIGDYDVTRSCLLLSPTLQDVREALATMLFDGEALDTLTITFAGHGAVSSGSFYMALRDSRVTALSATALSLADLFRMIAEAAPKQTYLVIDACQSGGLISDLNVILKSEVMGEFGTPGVTLLATAASNETAVETGGHGIGTAALLDCIRGDVFLQDSNPALDLVEIGREVSARVGITGAQTPVVWGLNLYGPSSFCKNPHAGTGDAPLRSVLAGWPDADTAAAIRAGLPQLWEPYVSVPTRWEPRQFLDRLAPMMDALKDDPAILLNLIQRLSETFAARARASRDRFREIEVRAACAIALLPFCDEHAVVRSLSAQCIEIAELVELAIGDGGDSVDAYRYALVTGGLGDLYHLPIRLSKLIGWAGFAVHTHRVMGRDTKPAAGRLASLLDRIFDTYSLSLVAMSDCQAPYVMSAMTACAAAGMTDAAERFLGHMFASTIACAGRVARCDLDGSKTLAYLVARGNQPKRLTAEMVAQPTELVLALLRLSSLFDLAEEFDTSLGELDHLPLNAYLADDYRQFGQNYIMGGTNAVFVIGHEFWTIAELEAAWPDFPAPDQPAVAMTALLASLLLPDRSPWFLLPTPSPIEAQTREATAERMASAK